MAVPTGCYVKIWLQELLGGNGYVLCDLPPFLLSLMERLGVKLDRHVGLDRGTLSPFIFFFFFFDRGFDWSFEEG